MAMLPLQRELCVVSGLLDCTNNEKYVDENHEHMVPPLVVLQ